MTSSSAIATRRRPLIKPPGGSNRAHPAYFWGGSATVTLGVALHLPMFVEAAKMNFHLAGMPVDWRMLTGMGLIGAGTAASWYGLLPAALPRRAPGPESAPMANVAAPSTVRARGLGWPEWQLMFVLSLGLVIDSMKPASLAFTIPGMSQEYGLPREVVALFPLLALTGLTIGSYFWGVIGDQIGRRAAVLLSAVMFVGTAICGSMPGFIGNLIMCFFMGLAAGGMLPITYALLAECVPAEQRGWAMVLVGGLGLLGGFFAASGCAAVLEPLYGWRIMWFLNAPTGLLLILFNHLIPESPRFLMMRGRIEEARALVSRFRMQDQFLRSAPASFSAAVDSTGTLLRPPFRPVTVTLNHLGIAWGLLNFGLLLWLPADLRARGYNVLGSDLLLFRSALLGLPAMFVVAWLYGRWSTKWTLFVLILLTTSGLASLSLIDSNMQLIHEHLLVLLSVLTVGANGIIAVLLPYAAENYPVLVRGRGTGLVAGASKLGGLVAQALTLSSLVPTFGVASITLALPMAISASMIACFGRETCQRRLEHDEGP